MAIVGLLSQKSVSAESCTPCGMAEDILKPCNATLEIEHWPGKFTYQPTREQAVCACNENYYVQMTACVKCQSSSSAHLSIKPLAEYQDVCKSFGVFDFPKVHMPTTSTSIASTQTTTSTSTPTSDQSNSGSTARSGLSSGAVAGIIVSAIALIVALSVAGYVYTRRRRELAKQKEDDDLYKYQENSRQSYMESPLPQYTGIQSSLPSLPQLTNLRVMNPDNDEDEILNSGTRFPNASNVDAPRTSSPGWRRGSFDD
ncbi:hypothetical protein BCR41DRAFT_351172, partial [Lobosporangium transversale]